MSVLDFWATERNLERQGSNPGGSRCRQCLTWSVHLLNRSSVDSLGCIEAIDRGASLTRPPLAAATTCTVWPATDCWPRARNWSHAGGELLPAHTHRTEYDSHHTHPSYWLLKQTILTNTLLCLPVPWTCSHLQFSLHTLRCKQTANDRFIKLTPYVSIDTFWK